MKGFFNMAIDSLLDNRLRSTLTILIIAIGITSLVSIQTAIEGLSRTVERSFGRMGAHCFTISSLEEEGDRAARAISLADAQEFVRRYDSKAVVSITSSLPMQQVSAGGISSDPTVTVTATDEHRLHLGLASLAAGRNFSSREIEGSSDLCIIGDNIARQLFSGRNPLGETLRLGAVEYSVTGVMEREGSLFGIGTDNTVLVPLGPARTRFLASDARYSLDIMSVGEKSAFEEAWERAVVVMKLIRGLRPQDEANFAISRSDSIIRELDSLKGKLSIAALVIGLITLLGASVGLMNILLVSVKERTCEIGIRKALGAKPRTIAMQFLTEAMLIGQIGCAAGLLLGLLFGNLVALMLGCAFTLPWRWLGLSVLICMVVSILSGYLPARRASRLDPIEALRCE